MLSLYGAFYSQVMWGKRARGLSNSRHVADMSDVACAWHAFVRSLAEQRRHEA